MEKKNIIIVCGEPSGDLHASLLAQEIKSMQPEISISGVGGPLFQKYCDELYCDIEKLAVLGLTDVLKKLPEFIRLKRLILKNIQEKRPSGIILIDFSGFNLRLAKAINNSCKTIYYISPQVWASRSGRVKTIKKYIQGIIVFFKFEQQFYLRHGIKAEWVGHPLLDIVKPASDKKDFFFQLKLSTTNPTFALLPGSRRQEIDNILPIMLDTAKFLRKALPAAQFILVKPPQMNQAIYHRHLNKTDLKIVIVEEKAYDCIAHSDFCLVASGTATLETAILQKPFIIIYKMNLLNYLLYRPQVRIPFVGMVNIVAGKRIIPEFIQFRARPRKIAQTILDLWQDKEKMQEIKLKLKETVSLLGEKGATRRAAQLILNIL